ncbi:MAG: hypothetical protein EBV05_12875, partial [Cyanobacteria bacterium WB6_1B_304]|nr:hypothetical protein [Cyanobacteria bacterium WB6_1B_304]
DLAINLPSQFSGFINSAGHLHLGFPLGDATKITGQIQALGISGNVKEELRADRYADPLLVPGTFLGSLRLTGDPAAPPAAYAGIPGAVGDFPAIDVDGIAGFALRTDHGDIGPVSANAFAATFVAEADAGSVGFLDASDGEFAGHVRAQGDIAGLRTVLDVTGTLVSEEGDVGPVSVAVGGFAGFIRAAGDVGAVRVFAEVTGLGGGGGGVPTVAIQAGGSIASVESVSLGIDALLQAGDSIGAVTATGNILAGLLAVSGSIDSITSHAGFIACPSIQAGGDVGPIAAHGGILDTSIVAGGDVGMINVRVGLVQLLAIRAGDGIAGITIVDGSLETSSLVAGGDIGRVEAFGSIAAYGISDVSLVAETGAIGEVIGRTHTGNGIEKLKLDAGTSIGLVRGVSYGEYGSLLGFGIVDTNAVAASIGTVLGIASGGTAIKTSTFITRTALDASGNALRTNAIGSVTGRGWRGGLDTVTVVAHGDIGTISGVADSSGSGISGGSFDSHYGKIGAIVGVGGPGANGHGLDATRFQATDLQFGGIGRVTATASAGGGNAISDTKLLAGGTGIGPVRATVHGGVDGNGMVGGEIRSFAGPITSVDVIVRSTEGRGIVDGKIQASGDIGALRVTTLAKAAIDKGEFTSRGTFGAIRAEAQKGGVAISGATFQALGRIADPADPATWNADPLGNFGTVTAIAGGTAAADRAIDGATFEAIGGFGKILATSRGGEAIKGSTFTADSDGNDVGSMVAIEAINTGRQRASSAGIVDSTFTAAGIGPIMSRITTIEGGVAIKASTFTATTAIYDGFGNFDDTGAIGAITVTSAASEYGGIVESTFAAGAAGRIVAVAVTSASGIGIIDSEFSATRADVDQNL